MEGFRISPLQRHLWSLRDSEERWAYYAQCAVRITGKIETPRLRNALTSVVERHEILRTVFPRLKAMAWPLQVIREEPELHFAEVARPLAGQEEQTSVIAELLRAEALEPFDPAEQPPLRVLLVRFSSERGALLVTLPALAADGISLARLVGELAAAYDSKRTGGDPPPMQYADVAEWQNALLEGEESRAGRDYWRWVRARRYLGPALPFERSLRPPGSFEPETLTVRIDSGTAERMAGLAASEGTDASSVLLAGWALLLWHLTGASDFLVGCEEDGRVFEELRDALGPCGRALPLACQVDAAETFRRLLAGLDSTRREQRKWQDYFAPESLVTEPGGPEPFFPVGFLSRKLPAAFASDEAVFTLDRELVYGDRFELRLALFESQGRMAIELQYDGGLFSSEHMRLLAARLSELLERASRAPEASLEALTVGSGAEEGKVPAVPGKPGTMSLPIHRRFEAAARRVPAEVVLRDERGTMTREELDQGAERVARWLQRSGVGPESVVGILAARSRETVMALLGAWKAGAAYLPIDPATPPERLAFMLSDSGAAAAICPKGFAGRLSSFSGPRLLLGEDSGADDEKREELSPLAAESAGNLAYVIYTSGSTGEPKGVAVEHRQLASYVDAILELLDPPPESSFALVSSFAADLGHSAIFPPLASGGCLHVLSEERASDPEGLADYFQRYPVDYLKIVPSHLEALLSGARPERILPVRCLVLGGEPSRWELIEKVRSLAPHCEIVNHYGPTETTVGVAAYRIPLVSSRRPVTVPVGRPLGRNRILVLDRSGRPAPLWAAGGLHVAGESVARGYVNRPDATAARFLPDAEGEREGARLYATGDVARRLPDGDVELLGRADSQVKIHGFRVELGEIEVALRRHPSVRDAAASVREDEPGLRRLAAYVVADERPESREQLSEWLRSRLPEFMIPSAFVFLDRIPRTASGKIDRRALPVPPREREERRAYAEPRTAQEEALATVWASVLGVDRVGIHDNFFHLGGDSILGILIVARAARAGMRLTPRQLFQHQTVAELAAAATGVDPAGGIGTPLTGPVPLTPIQHWFFEQELADPHHYNQTMGLEIQRPVAPELLERVVAALVAHHDALRLRFSRQVSGWSQHYEAAERHEVFSHHDLSSLPSPEQDSAVRSIAARLHSSLDLTEGPLVRVAQFDLGSARPARLLWLAHHLAVDGVSWRILREDLETGCHQLQQGEPLRLPAKTTSFREWGQELVSAAGSPEVESELSYWAALHRVPAPTLPVDRDGGANTMDSVRAATIALDPEETRVLLQEVPAAFGTQINDVLVTALLLAFSEWTGSSSLLIEMEGHGREPFFGNIDLSRTVGWFTSRFPIFVVVPGGADLDAALTSVREQLRRVPRRGIGYGVLRYLSADPAAAQLRELPQPLVSFNYLGQYDRRPEESLFALSGQTPGPIRSPRGARRHWLTIEGKVRRDQLRVSWIYSENIFDPSTIDRVAAAFQAALRRVILDARSVGAATVSLSEFPDSGLTRKDLETLMGRLQADGKGSA